MENFESFLLLMDQLTLRNNDVQESEQFYEELVEILEGSEPRAFEYFSNTWLKHKEKWMMCYRQDADSTNNILHYEATTSHNEVFFGFQH